MKSLLSASFALAIIIGATPEAEAQRGPGGPRGDGERGGFGRQGGEQRGGFGRPGGGDRGGFGRPGGGERGGRGGFGGPGGGRSPLDTNGDGQIDKEEISKMPEGFRQMLESRGIQVRPGSVEDFRNNMREQFEQRGREEGWGRQDDRGGRESEERGAVNRSNYAPAAPFRPREKKRVTVDLPPKYGELDLDFDGQIGLYEWITAKRESLDEFDEIDANVDGVLTPKELQFFDQISEAGEAQVVSYRRDRVMIIDGKGTFGSRKPGQKKEIKSTMSSEDREKTIESSRKYFSAMDKNENGRIDREEWESSKRIRPWFEKSGIEMNSMSQQEFADNFVTAVEMMKQGKGKDGKERDKEKREWKR